VIWTVCFIAILLPTLFSPGQTLPTLSHIPTFIINPIICGTIYHVVICTGIPDFIIQYNRISNENQKILGKISIGFATIFTACIGIHYFVQISSVRLSIAKDQLDGLTQLSSQTQVLELPELTWLDGLVFQSVFVFICSSYFKKQVKKCHKILIYCQWNHLHFRVE